MSLFDVELAKHSRTPQLLLEIGVPYCSNHYASGLVPNQLLHTEDFSNAAWVKTGVTVTANDAADPNGDTKADKLAFAAEGDTVAQSGNVATASKTHDGSFYLKATSAPGTIILDMRNDGGGLEETSLQVNLTLEWQRFSVRRAFGAGAGGNAQVRIRRATGDLAEVHAWGGQLTEGAATFSYVENAAVRNNASKCQVADAGDGARCFYTYPTCQDRLNYGTLNDAPEQSQRVWRFCSRAGPLPLPGEDILPYLEEYDYVSQEIDPQRSVTISDRVTYTLADDAGPGLWDLVRASQGAKVNTQRGLGTFWRRWLRIHPNYTNPLSYVALKSGFVASGFTRSLYESRFRGLPRNLIFNPKGTVRLVCSDRLKLAKVKIPNKISADNTTQQAMTDSQTGLVVKDAAELGFRGDVPLVTIGYPVVIQVENEKMNVLNVNTNTNTFTVQRGRWGTVAASHAINIEWKEIAEFGTERTSPSFNPLGKNLVDIMVELLRRAGFTTADINLTLLNAERDRWLKTSVDTATGAQSGPLLLRTLEDQTDIEALLRDLREKGVFELWTDQNQKVSGRALAPPPPDQVLATLTDQDNLIADTIELDDNQDSRINQVVTAWQLAIGESGDQVEHYNRRHVAVAADEQSAAFYGDVRQLTVLNRWRGTFDDAYDRQTSLRILSRRRRGIRKITAEVELRDDRTQVGDYVMVTTARLQTEHGATISGRQMQVLKKKRVSDSRNQLTLLDLDHFQRIGFFSPSSHPTYNSQTPDQRRYGSFGNQDGTIGANSDPAYVFW